MPASPWTTRPRDVVGDPFQAVRRCTLVLVYGTLKRSYRNHPLIADARCHGPTRSEAAFRMHHGALPAVDRGGRAQIEGELVEVDGEQLARIDRLERHPDWYRRERITLIDGREAWMYLHPVPANASPLRVTRAGVAIWDGPRGGP